MAEKDLELAASKQLDDTQSDSSLTEAGRTVFGHGIDGDDALKAVGGDGASIHIDEATNRRLVRKIDLMMMPVRFYPFFLSKAEAQTLTCGDRFFVWYTGSITLIVETSLSYASVTGFQKEIHLEGDNYQWLGSIFYFGYLGFEFVAIRLLQMFPLAKYSGFCIIAWGIVIACFAAVENFAGAVVIRVLLGVLEASVSPGWALFTSQWYKKEEQAIRTAWWISFNGWAQIFGGLVAYGFAHGSTLHGYSISPWKAIYIFVGVFTVVGGVIFLMIVPDNQLNAKWLSPEDRVLAIERVRGNQQGIGNKHFKPYQLREMVTDPAVWAFFVTAIFGTVPNGGLTNFFNLLLESFGYNAQQSLLYGCISGAIEIVTLLGWAYASRYFGYRVMIANIGVFVALIGSIILVALPLENTAGRLTGFFLTQFFTVGLVSLISLLATNIAGYTKKTAVAGGFFIFYSAGNIIGPQTFRPQDQPYYRPAEIVLIVCYGVCFISLFFITWWYRRENKRKDAVCADPSYVRLRNQEFLDLTDRENPEFRYVL